MTLSLPAELTEQNWRRAGRALLAKSLGELSYEQLLEPVHVDGDRYRVDLPEAVSYAFTARRGAFQDWRVDPATIVRTGPGGGEAAEDPLRFFLDAYEALGVSGDTAGHFHRELSATLVADARLLDAGVSAAELAGLDYVSLEGYQTGHPWLIPNKGRVGFSDSDAELYGPESRRAHRLPWMAVHRSLADYRAVPGLDQDVLLKAELGDEDVREFTAVLAERGLEPAEYVFMPVHPWQWDHVVVPDFAAEIAQGLIAPLGTGSDRYVAQQSIRTFANVDDEHRHFVKLPLSVLNTLVWRGLPTERTVAAPAVTSWIQDLAGSDAYLRQTGAVLLGEVASVAVRHRGLERITNVPYQYRELLGAIWREPLAGKLDSGERARTLAALLHVDAHGTAFVTELVRRSGLDAQDWLRHLFHALMPPLLHFLYHYGVVFSPHGENTIFVCDENDVPTRLAVKDFVDDVNISETPLPELSGMPADVDDALLREPPEMLRQFVQSGLFVGHFRYFAPLVEEHLGVSESAFWTLLREEVLDYQRNFPELAERFEMFNLFTPRIDRLCLNRNRLLLDAYRDRPERPHAAVHGTVPNPLAGQVD
ncbi:IucA/IucC family protein [Bounagaea algeriensis]